MASDQRSDQEPEISDSKQNWTAFPLCYSFPAGVVSLTGGVGLTSVALGWWFSRRYGFEGWQATLLAAVVVWQSSVLGMVVASRYRGQRIAVGTIVGMVFRLALPLAVTLVLLARGSGLVKAGFLEASVLLYQVALTVETKWAISRAWHDLPAGPNR